MGGRQAAFYFREARLARLVDESRVNLAAAAAAAAAAVQSDVCCLFSGVKCDDDSSFLEGEKTTQVFRLFWIRSHQSPYCLLSS